MPRTHILGLSLCLWAGLAHIAGAVDEIDPSDLVPRLLTVNEFAAMTALELYDVNLALKQGRTIEIEGCSPSQTRAIIEASHKAGAPALDLLRATCGS